MCGIVGFFRKTAEDTPVGCRILGMLNALACRGPDSAGVALYGPASPTGWVLQVKLGDRGDLDEMAAQVEAVVRAMAQPANAMRHLAFWSCKLPASASLDKITREVEKIRGDLEVVSAGEKLRIVKQIGSPRELNANYEVDQFQGSHGLGHTRLSTESIVDLSHSQPFWSHGYPDLAIVHNGHITNYHQLRRQYEQSGVRFYTENDSEVIAIYLARQLRRGLDLEQALKGMLRDLDGSFSCLAATGTEFGFAKDAFAFKPLVFTETEEFVAVATEEVAIRSALAGNYRVREAQIKDVRVWRN
jgi:methylamine---glutamate N-methyltransferase subunit A